LRPVTWASAPCWEIDYQGINVADAASGVGGDITITHEGKIVFAAEVTERPLERARIVATFNTKIAPNGIEDYLFFVRSETLADDARQQARQYFAQGHEVNFLEIKNWVLRGTCHYRATRARSIQRPFT
jgi:hypothetical protein